MMRWYGLCYDTLILLRLKFRNIFFIETSINNKL